MSDIFRETEVGARYAKAAFALSEDARSTDAVYTDIEVLKALLIESADLRRLLTSHLYSADDKLKGLLAVAAGAKLNDLTVRTLSLMAQKGRLDQVPSFITAFNRLYDVQKSVVAAEVTSAVALTDTQLSDLKGALRTALGRDAVVSASVDPGLLGGLKVRVGSRLFDASLKTKLDSLKFALKRA